VLRLVLNMPFSEEDEKQRMSDEWRNKMVKQILAYGMCFCMVLTKEQTLLSIRQNSDID